jgi:hypothetical protein
MVLALGQTVFSEPESLPTGDALRVWLFERPLIAGGIAGFLVVLVAWKAIQRASRRLGLLALGGLLLAIGLYTIGQLVTTTRERLMDNTDALAQSIVANDSTRVDEIVSESVSVAMGGSTIDGVGKQDILSAMRTLPRLDVRDADVAKLQAQMRGPSVGLTQARVRVDVGGTPNITWWRFDWRREGDGQWRVFRMRCLLLNGREPSPAMFSRVR